MLTVLTFDLSSDSLGDGQPVTIVADGDTVYSNGSSLYVAGDASRAVQWVIVAAAEGAEAAFAINTDLLKEDLS